MPPLRATESAASPPGRRLLALACRIAVVIAVVWVAYGFWRLALQPRPLGAIDLRLRRVEVQAWFAGEPIYFTNSDAVYPPASYLLLWPFLGWQGFTLARLSWLAVTALLVALLARLTARQARAGLERRALVTAALASYPVGATIGNGQLGIAALVAMLALLPMLRERDRSLARDGAVAVLLVVALVKPSISAHFFWVVLFAAGSLRPAMLTAGLYAALTALSSLWQKAGPLALLRAWLRRGTIGAAYGAKHGEGSIDVSSEGGLAIKAVNLHSVLGALGWMQHLLAASVALLLLLGVWVWLRRRSSVWTLAGVCAIVAIFSSHHSWYDHILLLLPLVALVRDAPVRAGRAGAIATALAVALSLSLLAPGGLYALPQPWSSVYVLAQSTVWLAVLAYLLWSARQPPADDEPAPSPA